VFGGTTYINSGTCFRTPTAVLKNWREKLLLSDFNDTVLNPIFEHVEKILHVAPADYKMMSRPNLLMKELFEKEGISGAPLLRNTLNCTGCGMCCYGCDSGAKQSVEQNYLPMALKNGAQAFVHAKVTEITYLKQGASKKVTGIIAQAPLVGQKLGTHKLMIKSDLVFLAAGTFSTPQLLFNNKLAHRNPHLGKHLTIHPATKVYAEFDETVDGWKGIPQAYYTDHFHDEGLMFEGIITPPDLASLSVPYIGRRFTDFIKNYRHMMSFGFLIADSTEGRMISIPRVGNFFWYSLTSGDALRFRRGISILARILIKGGAKRVITLGSKIEFTKLREVEEFENRPLKREHVDSMAFHPLGTCRMAARVEDGVVDQTHRVFGVDRLYVCDGSVVPTALGVNPQITIMAMATRLSQLILGGRLKLKQNLPNH
jgi:choline dehydrogenase-like flavoprotein